MFQAIGAIIKISTLSDGSIRLVVDTREMGAEDMTRLFSLKNQEGWFMFQEKPFTEVPDLPDIVTDGRKTPSQRIRAVLYKLWEQGSRKEAFENYYISQTEKIITWLKEKLN